MNAQLTTRRPFSKVYVRQSIRDQKKGDRRKKREERERKTTERKREKERDKEIEEFGRD